jgi:uncharacterized membrane protein
MTGRLVRWAVRAAAGALGVELVKRKARKVVVDRVVAKVSPQNVAKRVKAEAQGRVRAALTEGRSAAKERETSLRKKLRP